MSNSFFICSLGNCRFLIDYASNVACLPEVFFKYSSTLFASVNAGEEIMEMAAIMDFIHEVL